MKITLCKFCDYSCPTNNGKHVIVGTFNHMASAQFPCNLQPFHICVEMEIEPEDYDRPVQVEIRIIDEDGRFLFNIDQMVEAPRGDHIAPPRTMASFGINGLPVERPGIYRLDVVVDGHPAAEERLFVTQAA